MAEERTIGIPYPPDFIFKYRKDRITPARSVMNTQQSMFIFEETTCPASFLESKEKDGTLEKKDGVWVDKDGRIYRSHPIGYEDVSGQLAWFQGVKHPAKGWPFPEALYAVNAAKKVIRNELITLAHKDMWLIALAFIFSPSRKKILERRLESFNDTCASILTPYLLEEAIYSPCAEEILKIIRTFLLAIGIRADIAEHFAENFSILIQYDNAYSLRIEDIMSETTKEKFMKRPVREMQRLIKILGTRDPGASNVNKFASIVALLKISLYIPSFRKAFYAALNQCDFSKLQYDAADRYHTLLWADYNFTGRSIEERIEEYKIIHKDGFPPRFLYTPQ